jgi:NAD(P)-dependent dehydrogenase (short-subunit alcohol dehydrogenase family)
MADGLRGSAALLVGKHVVVVGGASGIGLAVAEGARDQGARVTVASSQAARVEAAAAQLGLDAQQGQVQGLVVDVRDEASVEAFFERVGAFDHLVFTAGDWGGRAGSVRDVDIAAAQAGLAVRFWGAVTVVKHASRSIAQDGSITLTGGMLAHRPRKGIPLTTAFAGASEHLVRGLAVDLAPVRVNLVAPGLVLTEAVMSMPQAMRDAFTARLPLPRPATPAEAAEAYLYLMRGGYTTGQVLIMNGGTSVV